MKRGFKGKRRRNDPTYKPYDPAFHPENLIELMSMGLFNCEIEDRWYISHATFHRWKQENEELENAYQVGLSKRKSYYIREKIRPMIDGDIEGKHSFNALKLILDGEMQYTTSAPVANGNTININNISIANSTPQQLIEKLTENLQFLQDKNVLQPEYTLIEHDSQSDEQNS